MPSAFSALDTGFPALPDGESTEQKLSRLYDYVFLLLENLRYILRHLSADNFNDGGLRELGEALTQNETVVQALTDALDVGAVLTRETLTDELTADYGAIADLTVSELRTDWARAARYLAGNRQPIDYLHIHGEQLDFLTGTVAKDGNGVPLTEQLHHGDRYFWWKDAEKRSMTSLTQTDWPVTVYRYDVLRKGSWRFDTVVEHGAANRIPELVFGAGYGQARDPDRGRGFLRKSSDSLDFWLLDRDGRARGVFIGDADGDGYTDITGLRKTTALDFSDWDAGIFRESIDGGLSAQYAVEFDAQDRPVKITDADGHETAITWEA